jgi:fatty-acyl-CoA synthase
MQTYSLTVDKFLDHAAKWSPDSQVVTAGGGRIGYAGLRDRAVRLSGALAHLGLGLGDRIATLAWNTQHHVELYYAAMGAGLVCHTLNPRVTAAHLAAMINEAEDRVLALAANLAPMADALLPLCPGLEHIVLMDGAEGLDTSAWRASVQVWELEALLADHGRAVTWGGFPEETPAGLCYTSGTTGRPKGVLYTHRSNYLHTLRALQADAVALTASDVLLVAVPMFHANGWGMPFAAPAVGATMVLPGRATDGASLTRLLQDEAVTVATGVQTVWQGVLDHLDKVGGETPALERVIIGGSACPDSLIRRMEDRFGARVQTSWGMTELSPVGTIAPPRAPARAANGKAANGKAAADGDDDQTRSSGRPPMGLDLKLTDAEGVTLAQQRGPIGHLKVKGASVVDRYFKAETDALDAEGYFDTGDLARLDEGGNLIICGRSKDLIKSGGEWINPAEIEDIIGRHPAVGQAAVIGREDARWGERPLLIVEMRQGRAMDAATLLGALRGKVADWWIPEQIVEIGAMPLAATGKIDKNQLRAHYASERGLEERSGG